MDPSKAYQPLPSLQQPTRNFARAHSLASSELNSFSESFHGDENFINPFLDESTVLANFYTTQNDSNSTTASSPINDKSHRKKNDHDIGQKDSNSH